MADISSIKFELPSVKDGFVGENINQKKYVEIIGIGGNGWTEEYIPIFQKSLFDLDFSRSSEVYWYKSDRYLIVKFNVTVNIWRIGVTPYPNNYNANLKIYKLDNSLNVLEDITSVHTTDWRSTISKLSAPNHYFVKFCSKLPSGIYKFEYDGYRLEGSWLLEGINSYLIMHNNKYYCPITETYDKETQMYKPIELSECADYLNRPFDLFNEITIAGETFKPVDKFEKFSVVSLQGEKMTIKGIKTKTELIVANGDIDVSIAETIHYFTLLGNQTTDTNIKVALSLDEGKTWYTYSSSSNKLTPLNIKIPLSNLDNQTSEQQKDWEHAKENILQNGININAFNSLDFNNLTDKLYKLRFAYVINKNNYDDLAELDSLQWNFDAKGIMRKMKNSEFDVWTYKNKIIVAPLIDAGILNTNILI